MRCFLRFRARFLFSDFFLATAACLQSLPDEIGSLPTAQLPLLPQLSPLPVPSQPRARRPLRKPVVQLTPEEVSHRKAVQKLGVNKHRLVHCELPNGKVRTGVITKIRDGGFMQGWNLYLAMDSLHRPQSRAPARTGNSYWPGLQVGWSWSWRGGPHTIFPIPVPGLGWLL